MHNVDTAGFEFYVTTCHLSEIYRKRTVVDLARTAAGSSGRAVGSSGQQWAAAGSSGQRRAAAGSSGQQWAAAGSSGQ